MVSTNATHIVGISVRRLFGIYDYDLPTKDKKKNLENIMILYGVNGSGKSTILKMLFHLLSAEHGVGHKSYVARVKFSSFEVCFSNGMAISASRHKDKLLGSYTMQIKKNNQILQKFFFEANEQNEILSHNQSEEKSYFSFLDALSKHTVLMYFLPDDRNILFSEKQRQINVRKNSALGVHAERLENRRQSPEEIAIYLLTESIKRAETWIQKQVMSASTKGESNVNAIYEDIINQIAHSTTDQAEDKHVSVNELQNEIKLLDIRIQEYSKYGLISDFSGAKLLKVLSAKQRNLHLISRILNPYLNGLRAKLDALEYIQSRIATLESTMNENFLKTKTFNFDLNRGIEILQGGERLLPHMLSSGERHLLLLFCNTITALDQPRILIIDEPELSLNVAWQRLLVKSLMKCVGNSPVQYIFATHSLEILSQHMDKVQTLEAKASKKKITAASAEAEDQLVESGENE